MLILAQYQLCVSAVPYLRSNFYGVVIIVSDNSRQLPPKPCSTQAGREWGRDRGVERAGQTTTTSAAAEL